MKLQAVTQTTDNVFTGTLATVDNIIASQIMMAKLNRLQILMSLMQLANTHATWAQQMTFFGKVPI